MYQTRERADENERAAFANTIFEMLYKEANGDLDLAVINGEYRNIFSHLDEHVRNIYEHIHNALPLWKYKELKEVAYDKGEMDYGYTPEEYDSYLNEAKEMCVKYYSSNG